MGTMKGFLLCLHLGCLLTTSLSQSVFLTSDSRYPSQITEDTRVKCTEEGSFPHPANCTWFYRCVDRVNAGVFQVFFFKCEPGTVFSDALDQCVFGNSNLCDGFQPIIGLGIVTGPVPGTGPEPVPGPISVLVPEPGPVTVPGTGAGPGPGAGPVTAPGPGAGPGPEPGPVPVNGPGPVPGPLPGTGVQPIIPVPPPGTGVQPIIPVPPPGTGVQPIIPVPPPGTGVQPIIPVPPPGSIPPSPTVTPIPPGVVQPGPTQPPTPPPTVFVITTPSTTTVKPPAPPPAAVGSESTIQCRNCVTRAGCKVGQKPFLVQLCDECKFGDRGNYMTPKDECPYHPDPYLTSEGRCFSGRDLCPNTRNSILEKDEPMYTIRCSDSKPRPDDQKIRELYCSDYHFCTPFGVYEGSQQLCSNFFQCYQNEHGYWEAELRHCLASNLYSFELDRCLPQPNETRLCRRL
ncbi:uncharacterized protein [Palaemon carinicauda]|uniref:uncharacterized protein n=1 Tax=Palaemon carinicauda TaxID=392227 RepID=UPI0035B57C17